jgi:hypothetical protein
LGEGSLPLYHQTLTSSNSIIRGQLRESGYVDRFISCKIDGYIDGSYISKSLLKPGIFYDYGLYQLTTTAPAALQQQSCIGISARYSGFRGDISWSLQYDSKEKKLGVLGRPKLTFGADI